MMFYPRPLAEYHEDLGPMLWWKFPIDRKLNDLAYRHSRLEDERDRLKAENERLRKASEPFSRVAGKLFERNYNKGDGIGFSDLNAGNFFDLRAALASEQPTGSKEP